MLQTHVVRGCYDIFQPTYKTFLNTPFPAPQLYVPAQIHEEFKSTQTFLLTQVVEKALEDNTKCITIFGDSGTGKTSAALNLCQTFWERIVGLYPIPKTSAQKFTTTFLPNKSILPIYMFLPHFNIPDGLDGSRLLELYLCQNLDFFIKVCTGANMVVDRAFLVGQILSRMSDLNILLLLDGFDELQLPAIRLWENGLIPHSNLLVIVFSQTGVFKTNAERQNCFSYTDAGISALFSKEFFMSPFGSSQINAYIEAFTGVLKAMPPVVGVHVKRSAHADLWYLTKSVTAGTAWEKNGDLYNFWLNTKLPELFALGQRPYVLTLILHVLPSVVKTHENLDSQALDVRIKEMRLLCSTEVGIYDMFVYEWFKFQTARVERRMEPRDLFNVLPELPSYFLIYSQNLASALVLRNSGLNLHLGLSDLETLETKLCQPTDPQFVKLYLSNPNHEIFFGKRARSELDLPEDQVTLARKAANLAALRRGCLLTTTQLHAKDRNPEQRLVRQERFFTFLHHSLVEYFASRHMFQNLRAELNYYIRENLHISSEYLGFNRRPVQELSQGILNRLVDRVKIESEFAQLLFEVVSKSADFGILGQMAANAITLLNLAGISLSGRDFRNIQICGANLSKAVMSNSDFRGANLANAILQNCCLANSQFQGCNFEGVTYGQVPSILHGYNSMTPFIIFSHRDQIGNEYIVTSYKDGCIYKNSLDASMSAKSQEFVQNERDNREWWLGGSFLIFVSSLFQLVGYRPDKKQIYFWDFESTQMVSTISDVKDVLAQEMSIRAWTTFNLGTQIIVDQFQEDKIKYFMWNMQAEKIVIFSMSVIAYEFYVFPSSLAFLINCQFESNEKPTIYGYSEFNDSALITIKTKSKFQILKLSLQGERNILEVFFEQEGKFGSSTSSVVLSPDHAYVAFSWLSASGDFKVISLASRTTVISEQRPSVFRTVGFYPVGQEYSQQFVFNSSSTLLATQYKGEKFINIWTLFPNFKICYQVQDYDHYIRYFRPTPQFTFCRPCSCGLEPCICPEAIAYYGKSAGNNTIDIVKLGSEEQGAHVPEKEVERLEFSPDFSLVVVMFLRSSEVNVLSVPVLPQGSLYSVFQLEADVALSSIGFWTEGSELYILFLGTNGLISVWTICGQKLFSYQLDDLLKVRLSSVDAVHRRICTFNEMEVDGEPRFYFSIFQDVRVDLEFKCITWSSQTGSQSFVEKLKIGTEILSKLQFFFSTDTVSRWIGMSSGAGHGFAICDTFGHSKRVPVCLIPRNNSGAVNAIRASCFGNFTDNTVRIFCSTVGFLYEYEYRIWSRSDYIRQVRRVKLPWGQGQDMYNTGILFLPNLKKLLLSYTNGDLRLISHKTSQLHLLTTIWHSVFHCRVRFNAENERVEIFLWDFVHNLTCISWGKAESDWNILWSKTRSAALLATSCDLTKSFKVDSTAQVLLLTQGQGSGTPLHSRDARKYTPFLDWFKGVEGEEVSGSMRPVFQARNKPEYQITAERWSLCVLRRSDARSYDVSRYFHTCLIVEGIWNSQRFILKTELTQVLPYVGAPQKEVIIQARALTSLSDIQRLAEKSECQTLEISSEKGLRLLKNIHEDQLRTRTYNFRTRNCISWCRDQIKEVGILVPDHWSEMFIVTPIVIQTLVDQPN